MLSMRYLRLLPIILLANWLLTGIAQIGPKERGVVRRFGAVVATPGPGLWIGLPTGIDRLDKYPRKPIQKAA